MPTNPKRRKQHSRVRSFDHGTIGARPEYVAAQKALDVLAHVLQRDEQGSVDRRQWLDLVADMASVGAFSDACDGEHAPGDPESLASGARPRGDIAALLVLVPDPPEGLVLRLLHCGPEVSANAGAGPVPPPRSIGPRLSPARAPPGRGLRLSHSRFPTASPLRPLLR